MMIEVKVGTRGEIVIPKKIREAMGITEGGTASLIHKGEHVEILIMRTGAVARMRERANKYKDNVEKWKSYDEIYEKEIANVR